MWSQTSYHCATRWNTTPHNERKIIGRSQCLMMVWQMLLSFWSCMIWTPKIMGLLWGRLALSSFHIILLPWLVADRSCVGVRGGTSFTAGKWNAVKTWEKLQSFIIQNSLSLSAVYDSREAPHRPLYIIFLCLHEDDFSFACQVATGLFFINLLYCQNTLSIFWCVCSGNMPS